MDLCRLLYSLGSASFIVSILEAFVVLLDKGNLINILTDAKRSMTMMFERRHGLRIEIQAIRC